VRNANLNNIWGTEEREGGMPFHKDELFDLIISNEPYGYEVLVQLDKCANSSRSYSKCVYLWDVL